MTEIHHEADSVTARPVVLVIASVFGVVLLALAVIGFAYDRQLGRPPYEFRDCAIASVSLAPPGARAARGAGPMAGTASEQTASVRPCAP